MADLLPTVGSGGISASYLNQLIQQTMVQRSQPLNAMKSQRDELQIQIGMYSDLNTRLAALESAAKGLVSSPTSSTSAVLSQKQVTVGDSSYFTAAVSGSAANGSYNITKIVLAEAHQVASDPQVYADQRLNLSGSFRLGGAAAQAQSTLSDGSGTVSSFEVASAAAGQTQLASGAYRVELRKDGSSWQFRVVDDKGQAQSVADAGATSYTSGWQALADVGSAGKFDTGRGLVVNFSSTNPGISGALLGSSAAGVQYTAQGTQISVEAGDSLNDIRDKINKGTYPAGSGVQASIVGNQLVLTAQKMGTAHAITVSDSSGNVLSGLGLYDTDWKHTVNQAVDGSVTVNNSIQVNNLESNTGLTNIIGGLTLNLLKPADNANLALSVSDDTNAAVQRVSAFVTSFNEMTEYLQNKTAVTKNADGKTYTAGALVGDSVFGNLRMSLMSDLLKSPSGLSAGAARNLRQIGLTFNDSMALSIADSSKLQNALTTNPAGVQELLDQVLGSGNGLLKRINTFTGTSGKTGMVSSAITRMNAERDRLDQQITAEQGRLDDEQEALTRQYSKLLARYADALNLSTYMNSILSSISTYG